MGGFTASQPMAGVKVAILGAGKMGGILLQAFLKSKVLEPEQIMANVRAAMAPAARPAAPKLCSPKSKRLLPPEQGRRSKRA